ncbi:conjugal transfer protein TraQ [Rugamonas apoptosis]|uniref:Conjugal transfer protein TraQ n=1 Tax=Rugamonas apoptosis TaxID=2758570 RepID=A0A7W2FF28_9BURK|nr:conjugal transfer protein TraQ [Rugamonas apoptosis]MBA5690553.1 conjugal transfer protein TraQ [Rugamonas apoptosis]
MDISAMLVNLARDAAAVMWLALWTMGELVGTLYCGNAVLRMSRAARLPGQPPVTMGELVPVMLVGGLMYNLSVFINATWNSMGTGTIAYGPVAYATGATFGRFADAINAVLTLASIAGGYFFFKGVILLKHSVADGQNPQGGEDIVWRALVHMIGGCMLVQIADMIERFRQTMHVVW